MKFGFIVPVYNTEKYLESCLLSLVNQTYKNFEIIIVDNYSNDNSFKIAQEFENKYDNIKIFKSKIKGVGKVRDFAIKKLNCDYFITIDSDDYINLNLLETLNNHLTNNKDLNMIRFNGAKVDSNGNILDKDMFSANNIGVYSGIDYLSLVCKEYLDSNKIFGPTWLYAIKLDYYIENKFKFSKLMQEDFGITSLLILKCNYISSIDFMGYYYVQRSDSITNKKDNKYLKALHLLEHYDNYINKIINKKTYNNKFKDIFKQYLDLTLLNKYNSLNELDRETYSQELKKRGVLI